MAETNASGNIPPQIIPPAGAKLAETAGQHTPPADPVEPIADSISTVPMRQVAQIPEADQPSNEPGKLALSSQLAPQTADDSEDVQFTDQPGLSDEAVSWTASEFIAHHKSARWYGLLLLAAIALAALVYLLTRDSTSAGIVIVAAILFGIVAARQPRQLQYALDSRGVQVGPKYHSLADFRSFSVVPEGAFSSVVFMPLKRFAPLTTIYFAPEDERRIVALLSAVLPFEDYRHDIIEQFIRRIRF